MRQQTLAAQTGFEKYGRKTKRERFLEEMEQVVPWAELEALVERKRSSNTPVRGFYQRFQTCPCFPFSALRESCKRGI